MKTIGLIAVGIFEVLCGLAGFVMVLGWAAGVMPYDPVPALWFGVFPLASMIAGVMLLLRTRYSFDFSRIVMLLQIPCIVLSGIPLLRVAIAFNFYLTAIWLGRNGAGPTILGFNILAIGVFILLIWARPALGPVSESADVPPSPPDFVEE